VAVSLSPFIPSLFSPLSLFLFEPSVSCHVKRLINESEGRTEAEEKPKVIEREREKVERKRRCMRETDDSDSDTPTNIHSKDDARHSVTNNP